MKPYYQDKYATIYLGDCLELLPEMPKVDLVLTDPPYGKKPSRDGMGVAKRKFSVVDNVWDVVPGKKIFDDMILCSSEQIIWGANYFFQLLNPTNCILVWDKNTETSVLAHCELAWTSFKKVTKIFRFTWNGMLQENMKNKESRQHPTQKPTQLMYWCIEQADKPKTILDPFMGSGTTLVAAKQLNRQAIGIEIEEKYCEIGAKRLSQEVLDLA